MHDDAIPTYGAAIDQHTTGHQFLYNLFGKAGVPRTGWTVDPFGDSSFTAKLNYESNFDYHVIGRISWDERERRRKDKTLQFFWENEYTNSSIFTNILYDSYCTPSGGSAFNFEGGFSINASNIASVAAEFVNIVRNQYEPAYRTNNLLFPFGCDFQFSDAEINFTNMTLLMNYINKNKEKYNMNLKYSLLTDYLDAINPKANKQSWPTYKKDFFPYADNDKSYWSGIYTSRPALKDYAREAERIGRTADALYSVARAYNKNVPSSLFSNLLLLREANGYVQHHDGITGTEREHVITMYRDYLTQGIQAVQEPQSVCLSSLLSKQPNKNYKFHTSPNYLLEASTSKSVPIIVYNSLGWKRTSYVNVTLARPDVYVTDKNGNKIKSTVIKSSSSNTYDVRFQADNIPPLGLDTFFIHFGSSSINKPTRTERELNGEPTKISNDVYDLVTDGISFKIKNKKTNQDFYLKQEFLQYDSYDKNDQASGAYIFRTKSDHADLLPTKPQITILDGQVVTQIKITFSDQIKQIIRLYKTNNNDPITGECGFIEIEYQVGVLEGNKELIARFTTDVKNNGKLDTDSQGLYTMHRTRNAKPLSDTLWPISSNYYPMVYSASIKDDKNRQMLLVSSATRGVATLQDGQLEMMLHRRTLQDDARGLDRPLNDTTGVNVKLRLFLDSVDNLETKYQTLRPYQSLNLNFPLDTFFFSNLENIPESSEYDDFLNTRFEPIGGLPKNLHLLSFNQLSMASLGEQTLLRVLNIDQTGSDAQVDLSGVVGHDQLKLKNHQETFISANAEKSGRSSGVLKASVSPLNIRTYLTEISK
ncbi:lysosomal alpha-mannosidase [Acrasis kona]|uniref:Alpha-mannosidase n=1 Tax=Acrasis kona TaxID=1008807 RepID=A0AAW2YV64_9EUKA